MASKPIVVTDDGLKKLVEELEELKTVKRKEVAETIKVALSFGDLSENSEYDEAKNEQAMVEARIAQLEAMLKNVKILDEEEIPSDVVNIGSRVRVLDVEFNEEGIYKIVGSTESNPAEGSISDESPLGRAILHRGEGEVVMAELENGLSIQYKILEILK
ncbi:MAG: transcription elongation factor GreA [Oscillospiraceae bacterium]|nr:transcription elongation factor GreA [Oscillospiraceae bacterium]MBQ8731947.1 transcription elongation factor GreA [Oscillospiraceae bacterium]